MRGQAVADQPRPGFRLSRRALVARLTSSAGLLVLAVAGCQSAYPTPAPELPPPTKAPLPTATVAAVAPTPTPAPAKAQATPSPQLAATQPVPLPTAAPATAAPAATPTAAMQAAAPSPTPGSAAKVSGTADLAIVRGSSPADITRAAVEAIGGISRFVPKGSTVVVKPNICTAALPEYAVDTNPEVVGTLVKMCKEAGASKVKVLDYGWGTPWNISYLASGIEEVVKQAGGEMVPITPIKWKKVDNPKAKVAKQLRIFDDVLTADVLINVPIAKHHGLSRLTLAMKNLMGVVESREPFHFDMGQNLSDLALVVKPAFTVLDAVRILTWNGPQGGNLGDVEKKDTVVASTDMVAIDAWATSLFGLKPADLETVRTGEKNGLGTADLSTLKIAEVKR